jgi:hypothetical protein
MSEYFPGLKPSDPKILDQYLVLLQQRVLDLESKPTQTMWFRNLVICLLEAIHRECHHMRIGHEKSQLLLAWSCRNLLELNVQTKWVLLNGTNAKEFVDDQLIGTLDILESYKRWMKFHGEPDTPEVDSVITDFCETKAAAGVVRTKYLKVSEMAADVKFYEEYSHGNKVTSKLVHPTSFTVCADPRQLSLLTPSLFGNGMRYAFEAVTLLLKHVDERGMEPAS